MKKLIRVAVSQYKVPKTSPKMLQKIMEVLGDSKDKADLVLLPEDCYPTLIDVKEGLHPYEYLSDLARKHKVYLAGATARKDEGGNIRSTGFLFDRDGKLLLEQNKMCLPPVDVEQGIKPDNVFRTVDTEFGRIAVLVCKDSFYRYTNDLFQAYRRKGVDIILIPTWSLKVNQRSISLVRDGIIAECNWSDTYICLSGNVQNELVTKDGTVLKAFGHAMVVCPLRGVLKEGSEDKEEILYEILEPKYLEEIRAYDKIWQPDGRLEFKVE